MELFLKPAQIRHLVPAPNFRFSNFNIGWLQHHICACPGSVAEEELAPGLFTLWKRASRTSGLGPHSVESDFPHADFWPGITSAYPVNQT
jgi:hypothetical protein